MVDSEEQAPILKLTSSYAYRQRKSVSNAFRLGEGWSGSARSKKTILLTRVRFDYIQISWAWCSRRQLYHRAARSL